MFSVFLYRPVQKVLDIFLDLVGLFAIERCIGVFNSIVLEIRGNKLLGNVFA